MPDRFASISTGFKNFLRSPIFRSVIKFLARVFACVFTFVIALFLLVWAGVFGKVPGKNELARIEHPIASEVYSADSVLLGRYYLQDRSPISPDEVPENLKQALIATEDVRFYQHHGVDVKSLFRVLVKTILLQKESSGGGSTITQQLAKNIYPRKSRSALSLPISKMKEFIIAWRLERVYTKDQLLVLYLNTIPFADNTYGVKTAADRFFSTPVKKLKTEQSAVLVGMLKATHSYNPRLFPERSLKRRNVVLAQMEKYEFISSNEKNALQAKPLALRYNNVNPSSGLAPYFRSYIREELLAWCEQHTKDDGTSYNLFTDGLKIFTTIDSRLQRYAEQAMKQQMKELQDRFSGQLSKAAVEGIASTKLKQLPQYQKLKESGWSEKEILNNLKKPLKTRIFTWEGDKETEMSVYDSLKHHLKFLQAGILATDPWTGDIKVWVGGIDHRFFQYDHVRETTKRQVGSTIKPILYAAALEKGIGPCSYISAQKTIYANKEGWTPENMNEKTYERKYSMEGGLTGSVNTVSVKLLEKTGINYAVDVAQRMGIRSSLPQVPSLALGTPSISVMEMVSAYGTLANGGFYIEPNYITAITDHRGNMLEQFKKEEANYRAISRETSQMIVHMLKSVVSEGTGAALRTRFHVMNDVAGKTGTTQSNVDGWFIAIMPKLVVGAWVGADDPRMHFRSSTLGQGSATALPIVGRLLQQANQDKSLRSTMWAKFQPLPEHVARQMQCEESKSNQNFFQKLFKKKKSVKVTKFKNRDES